MGSHIRWFYLNRDIGLATAQKPMHYPLKTMISIFSKFLGPSDDGETLSGPGPLTLAAFEEDYTRKEWVG